MGFMAVLLLLLTWLCVSFVVVSACIVAGRADARDERIGIAEVDDQAPVPARRLVAA